MAAPARDRDPTTPEPSPSLSPPRSVVDRVATPLSLFLDSREDPEPGPCHVERRPRCVVARPAPRARQYEPSSPPATRDPVTPMPSSASPPDGADHHACPLRTASVRADTRLAQPTPIATAHQPGPDLKMRPGSPLGKIAQLEATAERLSMTSSIDDAIRHLHGELKRSDSRRSSILAASLRASSADASVHHHGSPGSDEAAAAVDQVRSSIVSTNTAARHGGYSPAAFVMSPTHSLSGRLRSGSKGSPGRLDPDFDALLTRHGPGKTSGRSARSAKMLLAEISESEPISLTGAVLDEADAAPPLEHLVDQGAPMLPDAHVQDTSGTHTFHQVPESDAHSAVPASLRIGGHPGDSPPRDDTRCASSHSDNTFQQCRDAFVDFDGVHWEPEPEQDLLLPLQVEQDLPTPRAPSTRAAAPQSYLDPETGQEMQYYPARVPAMLNLPPKLSNKAKTAQRNQRQSKVLSVMRESNSQLASPDPPWQPASHEPNRPSTMPGPAHQAWFPDPLSGQRDPFTLLPPSSPCKDGVTRYDNGDEEPQATAAKKPGGLADTLRLPQRLSAPDPEKRKTRSMFLAKLPPQLRASAFFDLPSVTADVEIKDGSATATLDSILDTSANAPVSAFTDHTFAGKLGPEMYGKKNQKARKSTAAPGVPSPDLSPEPRPKKRASLMWLGKRSSSYNAEDKKRPRSMASAPVLGVDARPGEMGDRESSSGSGEDRSLHDEAPALEGDSESDEENESYHGPPTTLLAELQLRKLEQQQRKKNMGSGFPDGMHATLLEMDTVAETQRKHRQTKRVNLAWEEPGAHLDQNGSEDEDVPLAILGAMHHGAKNRADLERPMGLMERRALEDNEPLSRRRARLQGLDTLPPALQKRPSVMSIPALGAVESRSPRPPAGQVMSPATGPEEDEGENETLGERRRRLVASDGDDAKAPRNQLISNSFSVELLSQFGELNKAEAKPGGDTGKATQETSGEETLGQQRRRLQAEREAREREMSHGNPTAGSTQRISRRLSMADVLAAHPKKDPDGRAKEDEARRVDESRAVAEREAKMAAMRNQMPQSLAQPGVERSGGFCGGAFNDGSGGRGPQPSRASAAFTPQGLTQGPYGFGNYSRSSVLLNNYRGPAQQHVHGGMGPANHTDAYDGINPSGLFNGAAMGVYGGGMMAPMAVNGGSMDRVERWRRGVHP